MLLELAGENFAVAFERVDLVVGERAPFRLDLPFQLREIAFHNVFVHDRRSA
jgi:hypothetical protein